MSSPFSVSHSNCCSFRLLLRQWVLSFWSAFDLPMGMCRVELKPPQPRPPPYIIRHYQQVRVGPPVPLALWLSAPGAIISRRGPGSGSSDRLECLIGVESSSGLCCPPQTSALSTSAALPNAGTCGDSHGLYSENASLPAARGLSLRTVYLEAVCWSAQKIQDTTNVAVCVRGTKVGPRFA